MQTLTRTSENNCRVIDLIGWTEKHFLSKGLEDGRNTGEILLQHLLDCKRVELYFDSEKQLTQDTIKTFHSWIQRLIKNEPLQYITGTLEFYGLGLMITPAVFIPRPETERVVDIALQVLKTVISPKILDVGTGSGCIAIALANELPGASVTGIDIDPNMLKVAQKNADLHKINNIIFKQMDIQKEIPKESYNLIVSNPPYIPLNEMSDLEKKIKDFEPHIALTDGADGLTFYHRLASVASKILHSNGYLIMEVGQGDHPPKALKLFKDNAFASNKLIQDYNGDDRVLKVQSV
ncbi:MAG TPA: peptide chain release factor N(5)-glutamine methyltransferase [Candidatus Marinimicrobia bacterium]|jgi:release factor glutamine methyltransferase|nr:peptide chain release factor N(5)-glutamine methyltransferase [Candidatus Neomarinimicrobiota bacterium]MDP6261747.1 peptide chain release factor N(5)-glutamine methyltransferase [Candidatus Neomarinimicrobiota bacterium]MDP7128363.1 peptide chain release factor N(5)-glutamine methyltransferase [Candidatus Neomarinimicrobiota bacterium]MDP7336536.1 peptide chain release factor N(5)-glutamine methyltransferase [Candidatus Neomarinimicrobiota bacterium]MDP7475550.1 peptide chain release factor|tara:strand:- start:2976 stop:3854 length:879 start_codon:yes stop_codon:yes gene_type:complete